MHLKMSANWWPICLNALQWCVGVVRILQNFSVQYGKQDHLITTHLIFKTYVCGLHICLLYVGVKKLNSGWLINPTWLGFQ